MRAQLIALFVLALAARGLLLFAGPWQSPVRAMQPDSGRYFVLAENLARYSTFGKAEEDGVAHRAIERVREANHTLPPRDANGLRPDSFRTPGYPVFIAAALALWSDPRVVLLLQVLMGASLAPAMAVLAGRAGASTRAAVGAGVVWALHPALVTHDNLFLSEGLFNAVCLAGVLVATEGTLAATAGSGLLLGVGAVVRPLGLLYLPMAMALAWRRGVRAQGLALLVVVALVPSALWAWRNHAAGEGTRVSTVGDHNLLFYTTPFAIAEERGEEWGELRGADELADQLIARVSPGQDVSRAARSFALEQMAARPMAVVRVHLKSWARLLFSHTAGTMAGLVGQRYTASGLFSRLVLQEPGAGELHVGSVAAATLWVTLNIAVVGLTLVGVFRAIVARDIVGLAAGATLALFVVATGSVGIERLRLPMLFPMLVLAAHAGLKVRATSGSQST